MTDSRLPHLGRWIVRRLGVDSEPLVGDLLEAAKRRSRGWFWRQLVLTILIRSLHREREVRPLRLVEYPSAFQNRGVPVGLHRHQHPINLSGGPVPGIGGLSIVALGTLVAVVSPQLWRVAVVSVIAGGLLGVARIMVRQRLGLGSARRMTTLRTGLAEGEGERA